ncbi:MAG: helix-turn-helix domain-containing protein [Defluviitaleaceae bacterium]|nr:helix-turn-helix domain-containing protein [Defluviitaleaceae bacterium]
MLKASLLDRLFRIPNNYQQEKADQLKVELTKYFDKNKNDAQIKDSFAILEMYKNEQNGVDFEMSQELMTPVLNRILSEKDWDFYDFMFLAAAVDFIEDYKQVPMILHGILKKFEKFSDHKKYLRVRLAFHMNGMQRLCRAKYFDLKDTDDIEVLNDLTDAFLAHSYEIMLLYNMDMSKYRAPRALAIVRKGIFLNNLNIFNKGISELERAGDFELIRAAKEEASEYNFYHGLKISKRQFNAIVGQNIRRIRKAAGFALNDLAAMLNMTSSRLSTVERGSRGLTNSHFHNIANIFGVSMDEIFNGTTSAEDATEKFPNDELRQRSLYLRRLANATKNLNNEQLKFLITTIKSLQGLDTIKK